MYTTPVVLSVTLVLAAVEYTLVLPAATRYVEIQCTTAVDNSFSFLSGGPYMPIRANSVYQSFELDPVVKPLYFFTANAGAVMRVLCYPYPLEGDVLRSGPVGA